MTYTSTLPLVFLLLAIVVQLHEMDRRKRKDEMKRKREDDDKGDK